MDLEIILFAICLLVVGVWLILRLSSSPPVVPQRTAVRVDKPQKAAKLARQRSRQRHRVWWEVDNLYAEFRQRTGTDEEGATFQSAQPAAPVVREKEQSSACEDLTSNQVSQAFEDFLNKES